jgi:hypothetical protein
MGASVGFGAKLTYRECSGVQFRTGLSGRFDVNTEWVFETVVVALSERRPDLPSPLFSYPARGIMSTNCANPFRRSVTHTTKAEVICSRIGRSPSASARDIPRAVLIGAKKRACALHTFRHAGLGGVETIRRPFRIDRDFAARGQGLVVVGAIPIGGPLPYVARHIEQTIPVGGERSYRGRYQQELPQPR